MVCPRCEQGEVLCVILKHSGAYAYICDECDALWVNDAEVAKYTWVDFATYMKRFGGRGTWDEFEIVASRTGPSET